MAPILQRFSHRLVFLLLLILGTAPQYLAAQTPCSGIKGKVFADYNYNGLNDETATIGVGGVTLYFYGSNGSIFSATSDANGNYDFSNAVVGLSYRVEASLPSGLSAYKLTNGAVQFSNAPNCSLNFGISIPADFCQENPSIIVPCYVNGDPTNALGSAKDSIALVAVPFSTPNAAPQSSEKMLAKAGDIGSVWGVAYHKKRKAIITTSVLKRHVGVGPAGMGGIYFLDYSNPNTPSTLPILGNLSLSAGANPRTTPLSGDPKQGSNDVEAYSLIGKTGLGGVAVSDDGNTLWVMNLDSRKLVKIDLTAFNTNGTLPTTSNILGQYAVPTPCSQTGVFRPWAVKVKNGKTYIGGVCDASVSKKTADLGAYIYEFDGANFNLVYNFSLDYQRGYAFSGFAGINSWLPWEDDYTKMLRNDLFFIYPQPILSDIEFDIDGSIVLGFLDRMGHQGGYKNFIPKCDFPCPFPFIEAITISAGDIVRVCNKGGVLQLENPSVCSTAGATNGQGPGGGEFYWSDYHRHKITDLATPAFRDHMEVTTGGLAFKPGDGTVISTLYSPLNEAQAAGITWFNNTDGQRYRSFEIYNHGSSTINTGYFGKGNGLGDAALACQPAPVKIGNHVWIDCDGDGIQDADEKGLPNVKVFLLDINCNVLDSKTTDSDGNYAFDNLQPLTNYYIRFGNVGDMVSNIFTVNGVQFTLSPANFGQGSLADENDSDASLNFGTATPQCLLGKPHIVVRTGDCGTIDFSQDLGLVGPKLTVTSIIPLDEACNGANDGKITITASVDRGQLEYSIDGGLTFVTTNVFSNLTPKFYDVVIRLQNNGAGLCGNGVQKVEVKAGKKIAPPVTTPDEICQYNLTPKNGGLTATCELCPRNLTPKITWWTAAVGGVKVGEGATFNPITATSNAVNTANVGATTYYAQCECGVCVSDRTPSVFTVYPQPEPIVTGKKLVCPNEIATYSTPFVPGSTWVWTLSGGGVLTQNQNSVSINWNGPQNSGPYKLTVKETSSRGCSKLAEFNISIKATALACVGSLNASFGSNCKMTLTAPMLVGNIIGQEEMKVQILAGATVLEEGIGSVEVDGIAKNGGTYDFIGKTFVYKVIEPCTNNACWGNVKFEDKTPPTIQCPVDITLGCAQVPDGATPLPQDSGAPLVTDCSAPTTYSYVDQTYETNCMVPYTSFPLGVPAGHTFPTTGDIVKVIVRTFTGSDKWGNTAKCDQVISIRKAKIENVICPKDTTFECKNVTGPLTPSVTGYPLLDIDGDFNTAYDRFPVNASSCKIDLKYSDDTFRICSGSYKIARTWTIYDWCATDNPATPQDERQKSCSQLIMVLDKTPPTVSANYAQFYTNNNEITAKDTTVNFDGYFIQGVGTSQGQVTEIYPLGLGNSCGGRVRITLKADDWSCTMKPVTYTSSDSRVKMLAGYPQYNAATQQSIAIFEGTFPEMLDYTFDITVKDECGYAYAKKTFIVKVKDNIKPQAVCISDIKATLTTDGTVRVPATALNNGSSDNCGIDQILVRRMTNCQDPSDTQFRPYADFYCCDAGKTVMVQMRVWDQLGNYNDCMVNVTIEDKIRPTCIAPAPLTVVCTDLNLTNLDTYGTPSIWDNCGVKDTVYTQKATMDNCGLGSVVRKWVVQDFDGKKDSCTQIITIIGKSDFTVDFPDDIVASCFAEVLTPLQMKNKMLTNPTTADGHLVNNGCGVLAVEVKDDTLTAQPDACYKILRKITVIDWCKYNPNNTQPNNCYGMPVCGDVHGNPNWATENLAAWQNLNRPACTNVKERRFRDADGLVAMSNDYLNPVSQNAFSDGIICFTQIIKIVDNTPPQFVSVPKDTIVKNDEIGCQGIAKVSVQAQDYCAATRIGDESLLYKWIVVDKIGAKTPADSIILQGTGNKLYEIINGVSREGILLAYNREVTVYWTVYDRCNNVARYNHKLKIVDGKSPALIGLDKIAELGTVNGQGMATVNVSDILMRLEDNCSSNAYMMTQIKLVRATDNTSNTYPSVSGTPSIMLTCADKGKAIAIQIWTRDEAGNANYATATVNVQDNLNACSVTSTSSIVGNIQTELSKTVNSVLVSALNGNVVSGSMTTTTTGNFNIPNLTLGQNYVVKALRDDNPLNGVTTFDIAFISKHILDITPLTSVYKIIAADVNHDNDVNGADMLHMRNIILRKTLKFPNNTSWRFVDKKYIFRDPTNPFAEDFPEVVSVSSLPLTAQADFVGIKVGDVNGTVNAALTDGSSTVVQPRSSKKLVFELEEKTLKAGQEYVIPFKSTDFDASTFQFTLNHTEGVEIVKIEKGNLNNMSEYNFGKFKDALTTSWNGKSESSNVEAFTLVIKAKKDMILSEILTLGSNLTAMEAYDKNNQPIGVELHFNGKNTEGSGFSLYQNEPNPFEYETKITFNLPTETQGKITVCDASGRVLKVIDGKFSKGYNEVKLQKSDVMTTGVLYYRIDTPTHSATKKMIVID
jgi:hypothetical protein